MQSESHFRSKRQGNRSWALIVLGMWICVTVCHCFPRRVLRHQNYTLSAGWTQRSNETFSWTEREWESRTSNVLANCHTRWTTVLRKERGRQNRLTETQSSLRGACDARMLARLCQAAIAFCYAQTVETQAPRSSSRLGQVELLQSHRLLKEVLADNIRCLALSLSPALHNGNTAVKKTLPQVMGGHTRVPRGYLHVY
ncbi:protein mab-21 [Plakobranchus ocellatus]|uniref:Protein mab-21 n=1 Tax=Plakobranchus ocellatus TaxID=259542 RepID=A0AAV3YLK7_9GAST|nr:protein mab-21 [Plakobranchus ocellatus]